MERLEEALIILGLPSPSREAGAKHRKRMRPILLVHLRRHALRPPIRSETFESRPIQLRNTKKSSIPNSSTRPSLGLEFQRVPEVMPTRFNFHLLSRRALFRLRQLAVGNVRRVTNCAQGRCFRTWDGP
jgi:hypothetical protein